MGDDYVLRLLSENAEMHALLGGGPHFAVLPARQSALPSNVNQIIYAPEVGADHRYAIRVLEEMTFASPVLSSPGPLSALPKPKSAHFISDIVPPGTWQSGQTYRIGPNQTDFFGFVGSGILNSELPDKNSTAMHDIIVGLLCFDEVLVPLKSAYRVHGLMGFELFLHVVSTEILRFVHWDAEESIVYDDEPQLLHGSLGNASNPRVQTAEGSIRSQWKPIPGRESEAEDCFARIIAATIPVPNSGLPSVPEFVRSLLIFPSIRAELGLGDGASPAAIPHWLAYPILRLSQIVRIGVTCNFLDISSTKLLFGAEGLASPSFSVVVGSHWADQMASYVLAGSFNSDLGALFLKDPKLIRGLLKFRDSASGTSFRREIQDRLALNEGAECVSAINLGLREVVPLDILERARNEMVGLLVAQGPQTSRMTAAWNNSSLENRALKLWRKRSRVGFELHCSKHNIGTYDKCPCGSGDKVRFCCGPALSS